MSDTLLINLTFDIRVFLILTNVRSDHPFYSIHNTAHQVLCLDAYIEPSDSTSNFTNKLLIKYSLTTEV